MWAGWNEKDGTVYAALFNLADQEAAVSVSLEEIDASLPAAVAAVLAGKHGDGAQETELKLKELWTKETEYCVGDALCSLIPAHGAKLYRIEY